MCLYVTAKDKIKTCRFPILTWKWVRNDISAGCWNSPYILSDVSRPFNKVMTAKQKNDYGTFPYTYMDINDITIETKDDLLKKGQVIFLLMKGADVVGCVSEGFHSFTSHGAAEIDGGLSTTVLRPCIIPKGARYIKGKDHQVASTKIVVFDSWKSLVKYILNSKK